MGVFLGFRARNIRWRGWFCFIQMLGFQWRIVDFRVSKGARFLNIFLPVFEKIGPLWSNLRDFPDFLEASWSTCNFNWPNNHWLFYWINLRTFFFALWLKNLQVLAKFKKKDQKTAIFRHYYSNSIEPFVFNKNS